MGALVVVLIFAGVIVVGVVASRSHSVGTFSATGSMTTPREYATATLLPNGRVLIAGGAYDSNSRLASAELYTP